MQNCSSLRLNYGPNNEPTVDYIRRMALTISLTHFATNQSLLIGNEF
jgi:hypothetical protein